MNGLSKRLLKVGCMSWIYQEYDKECEYEWPDHALLSPFHQSAPGWICPLACGILHEEHKGDEDNHHPRKQIEYVCKREHGSLPDHILVHDAESAMIGRGRVYPFLLQEGGALLGTQCVHGIIRGQLINETGLVKLGPAAYHGRDNGNPDAASNISDEIV